MKFSDALEGFWLEKRRGYSEHTVNDYALTFRRFRLFIGDADVSGITADDVRRFLASMQERYKLKPKTVCNYWTALSAFWSWAGTELGVDHVIRGRVAQPDYRLPQIQPYTQAEVEAMIKACSQADSWRTSTGKVARGKRPTAERDRAIVVLLVDSGLRASELCDLQIRDYDRERGSVYVRDGKFGKDRTVFVGDGSKKSLWKYLLSRKGAGPLEPLFATDTGRHIDRNNLRQMLQRIGKRGGVTGVTVHRFRHTFAITFLRNGGNLLALQEMLGHEKLDTVRIYARLASVDIEKAQRAASPADGWGLG